jgi:hypothetical protein
MSCSNCNTAIFPQSINLFCFQSTSRREGRVAATVTRPFSFNQSISSVFSPQAGGRGRVCSICNTTIFLQSTINLFCFSPRAGGRGRVAATVTQPFSFNQSVLFQSTSRREGKRTVTVSRPFSFNQSISSVSVHEPAGGDGFAAFVTRPFFFNQSSPSVSVHEPARGDELQQL